MKSILTGGIKLLMHAAKTQDKKMLIVYLACIVIPMIIYVLRNYKDREHHFPFLLWESNAGKIVIIFLNAIIYVLFVMGLFYIYFQNITWKDSMDKILGTLHDLSGLVGVVAFYLLLINYNERRDSLPLFRSHRLITTMIGFLVSVAVLFLVYAIFNLALEGGYSNQYKGVLKKRGELLSEYMPKIIQEKEKTYRQSVQKIKKEALNVTKQQEEKGSKTSSDKKKKNSQAMVIRYKERKGSKKFSLSNAAVKKQKKNIYYVNSMQEVKSAMYFGLYHRKENFTISYTGKDAMDLPGHVKEMMIDVKENYDNKKTANDFDYLRNEISQYQCRSIYKIGKCNLKFKIKYYDKVAEQSYIDRKIKKVLKGLALKGKTDDQKVKRIHDWITQHVEYDQTISRHGCYSALKYGTTVCNGYALLTYKMLQEAGVDNRIITGKAYNGKTTENHAWNLVKIGKKWYGLDTTWDDCLSNDQYFLIGSNELNQNHFPLSEYSTESFKKHYPMSVQNYL